MENIILNILEESVSVKTRFIRTNLKRIIRCADLMVSCLTSGHKILLFGNGGSAADAQHMAAEFVNRFQIARPPLAAMALTTDTSIITSIGNDDRFDNIFSRQIRALGKPDDVAVGISTSGNSTNVINGMAAAGDLGMKTVAFTGPGGKLVEIADLAFCVHSNHTARIQESHITLAHILCDLVERILFGNFTTLPENLRQPLP